MKKSIQLIFSSFLLLLSGQVIAQEMVVDHDQMLEAEPLPSLRKSFKKASYTGWYDYIDWSSQFGVSYTRITNASLFPDTLVYQLYGDGNGGSVLGRVDMHSFGQILDPKDRYTFFSDDPPPLSVFNSYRVDSVAFIYRYAHNIPGSVDTLLIQFYNSDKIQKTTLSSSGRITATVGYDKINNKGSDATSEMRYELSEKDTTDWSANSNVREIAVGVPGGGITVPADGLFGMTISFIPGYEYSNGDTLVHDWPTPPTKKLNHFLAARYRDGEKLMQNYQSYNNGLRASSASRYRTDTWNNRYIPGHAWTTLDEQYYIAWLVTSDNVSVPEIDETVKIYPNPSVQSPTILEGDLTGARLSIYDLTGKVVLEEDLNVHNEIDLPRGAYIFQIEKDGKVSHHRIQKY